jgi:20S proteasome subunit beta 3
MDTKRQRARSRSRYDVSCFRRWVTLSLLLGTTLPLVDSQQQDPLTMNGGSLLAMAGKDCVALAVDRRFGSGPALVNVGPRSVLAPSSLLLVGFTGMEGDVQSLKQELAAQVARKYQRGMGISGTENQRFISPRSMTSLTSHVLYNRKRAPYFVEPLVIGLEPCVSEKKMSPISSDATVNSTTAYRPYLCSLDMIGATSLSNEFVCAGAAIKSIYGTAEAAYQPNLSGDELVEACGKAFLSALERDCLSGYGAVIYLITSDGIVAYELEGRND